MRNRSVTFRWGVEWCRNWFWQESMRAVSSVSSKPPQTLKRSRSESRSGTGSMPRATTGWPDLDCFKMTWPLLLCRDTGKGTWPKEKHKLPNSSKTSDVNHIRIAIMHIMMPLAYLGIRLFACFPVVLCTPHHASACQLFPYQYFVSKQCITEHSVDTPAFPVCQGDVQQPNTSSVSDAQSQTNFLLRPK